jgi:hypothetical protein
MAPGKVGIAEVLLRSLIFLIAALIGSLVAQTAWSFLIVPHYHCQDEVGFGFFSPGDWVHPRFGDTISEGWTIERLWSVWRTLCASVVVIAAISASVFPRKLQRQQKGKH